MRSHSFPWLLAVTTPLCLGLHAAAQDVTANAMFLNIANVTVADPPFAPQIHSTPAFQSVAQGSEWLVDMPGTRVNANARIHHAEANPDRAALHATFTANVPAHLPPVLNECRVDTSVRFLWQVTTNGRGVLTLRGRALAFDSHERMYVSALVLSPSGYHYWWLDRPVLTNDTFEVMLPITDAAFSVEVAFSGFTQPEWSSTAGALSAAIDLEFRRTTPSFSAYGTGCSGMAGAPTLSSRNPPRLGVPFDLEFASLPGSSWNVVWGLAGFARDTWAGNPLPFDLAPMGMPGCPLLVDPLATMLIPNLGGTAIWTMTVPDRLEFAGGVFFVQGMVLEPGVNAAGATISNAGEIHVGL